MKTRDVLLVVMLLCMLGLVAQASVTVTTGDGDGADAVLSNDNQGGTPWLPDTNHGGDTAMAGFRQLVDTRSRTAYVRFDLSSVMDSFSNTMLSMDADYVKQTGRTITVYGVIDGPGDYWDEMGVTYNNAAGLVPNPPTTLGNYAIDAAEAELIGTMPFPDVIGPFSSNTVDLDLASFLAKDTNGLVTLIFIGNDNEGSVKSKEWVVVPTDPNTFFIAPTLTMPDVNDIVARAYDPIPAPYETVGIDLAELRWTNPEPNNPGETVTVDVYWGEDEPNALEPNYGLSLLKEDVDANSLSLSDEELLQTITLEEYKDYYWKVDIKDTSFPGRVVPGYVWAFNTNNAPPVPDAGEDQYVWVNKATVDADTYLRDTTVRGGAGFIDVRGGGIDFAGYLRFDLSQTDANTIYDASLVLTRVTGASRDDSVTNGRFALYGLNNVAGNTPQNWDETVLMDTNTGQEWDGTMPMTTALTNGWITDLDDNVAGISEVITGGGAGNTITISGAPLVAFLQSRLDDNGLATFILCNDDGSDRGYGLGSKENATPASHPALILSTDAQNNGDAVVTLTGSVEDDDLPAPPSITVQWTRVSGPETVTIDPDDTLSTTVNLGTPGTYVFQLTANDTALTGSDTVQVYVGVDSCDAAQNAPGYDPFASDFNSDCVVDLTDFAVIAGEWLECNSLECMPL